MDQRQASDLIQEGHALLKAKETEQARALFEEATAIAEREHGKESPELLQALDGWLSSVSRWRSSPSDGLSAIAAQLEEQMVALLQYASGLPESWLIRGWGNVGTSAAGYDRHARAVECYENVLDLRHRAGLDHGGSAIHDRILLAHSLCRADAFERAVQQCDTAIAITRSEKDLDKYLGYLISVKGRSLLLWGRFDEAAAALEQAATLRIPDDERIELQHCTDFARRHIRCRIDKDGAMIEAGESA